MISRLKARLLREPAPDTSVQDALYEVHEQMARVRERFAWESEGDLIEACIYEMEALDARHRYLMGLARSRSIKATRRKGTPNRRDEG